MYSEALMTGQGLSLSEALSEGLKVTGVGLVVVFSVLVILMILLTLFKVVFYRPEKKADAEEANAAPVIEEAAAVEDEPDDEELIAVLTAAVAACMNTSTYKLKIKSYRRIDNNGSAWNKAGLRETINSRF